MQTLRGLLGLLLTVVPVAADGITFVHHERYTRFIGLQGSRTVSTQDLGPFSSDQLEESELWFVYCPTPNPGCPWPDVQVANGTNRATQESSFTASELQLRGMAGAFFLRVGSDPAGSTIRTESWSVADLEFRIESPTRMILRGNATVDATSDDAIAFRTRATFAVRLHRGNEALVNEELWCDARTSDDIPRDCPRTNLDVDDEIVLDPGTYQLYLEAQSTAEDDAAIVDKSYDARTTFDLVLTFKENVSVNNVPWSTVKLLYR